MAKTTSSEQRRVTVNIVLILATVILLQVTAYMVAVNYVMQSDAQIHNRLTQMKDNL